MSIVVPCYNTLRYLPRCLDSLVGQTLHDIEIICVNDGSPDGSLKLLRDYQRRYPNLVRVVDKVNGGLWNARWSGTDVAEGEYVAYVDSDDYVEPTFAESLYSSGAAANADIVVCGFRRIDEKSGRVLSLERSEAKDPISIIDDSGELVGINPAAWNKAFRRSLLRRVRRLSAPPAILEDMMLAQLAYLASGGVVSFTGNAPYNYMIHEGSMIDSVTPEQVAGVRSALLEVKDAYLEENAPEGLLLSLETSAFLHLGISMSFRLSGNRNADFSREVSLNAEYLDSNFRGWRHSPYMTLGYALSHGRTYRRLWAAKLVYKTHLLRPALAVYRFYIKHSGHDIKW